MIRDLIFSTVDYLIENPIAQEKGINPLVHFEKSRNKVPTTKKNYQTWVSLYDTLTDLDKKNIKRKIIPNAAIDKLFHFRFH